jgi:uncharacterized protein YbjT (DUF2867 family)
MHLRNEQNCSQAHNGPRNQKDNLIMTPHPKTLVLGANGKTGRRVAERLEQLGWPIRRGSRQGKPRFDWQDASSWPAALEGIQQIYITFQPDLAMPGAVAIIDAFTRLAVESGVTKLVLLSGRGEPAAQACEALVLGSGVDATIVRASWFAQNFSEGHFLEPIREGVLALPIGEVAEPFIDIDDIAEVVVAALTEPGHVGELYEVTGPRLLTFAEAIDAIGTAASRDLAFVPVSGQTYEQAMVAAEVPPAMAAFFVELMQTTLDGRNAHVTDGVQRAIGRPARDFADYARRAASTGLWSAA